MSDFSVQAIVFDFDGTILDTESSSYAAWQQTFEAYGVEPITFEHWVTSIGLSSRPFDPPGMLSERLGRTLDRDTVLEERKVRRDLLVAEQSIRTGVQAWLDEAHSAGMGLAIASSAPREWVSGHLGERDLQDYFTEICCAGDVLDGGRIVPGKPDPMSYRLACERLQVDPANAIAVEDSPHGITAANEAGLFTVAMPGPMTKHFDFSHADMVLESLEARSVAEVAEHIAQR